MVMVRPCQISDTKWNHFENAWETKHLRSFLFTVQAASLLQPVTKAEIELNIQQVLCRLGTKVVAAGDCTSRNNNRTIEMIYLFWLRCTQISSIAHVFSSRVCCKLSFACGSFSRRLVHTFSESGSYSAFLTRVFKKSACDAVQLSEVQPIKTMLFQDVFACIDFSASTPAPSFVRTTCYQAVLDGFEVVLQSMPESEQKNMQHLKSAALAIVPGVMQPTDLSCFPVKLWGQLFLKVCVAQMFPCLLCAWQEKILADLNHLKSYYFSRGCC